MKNKLLAVVVLISGLGLTAPAFSYSPSMATRTEVGFSPNDGAEELVLKVIGSAKQTIRVAAYSFTSYPIVKALVDARRRGVQIAVVVDYKNNIQDDRSGKARAALNALVNAGIAVKTISIYPIHHDKYMIVDDIHVETGSYNYSKSAAVANSENVLVLWNAPNLAKSYEQHWQSRYNDGVDYTSAY